MISEEVYRAGLETLLVAGVTSLLGAVGVSAAVAAVAAPIITGALVIGGLVAAQALLSGRGGTAPVHATQTAAIDPGAARNTFESAESPELRAVGRVRLGGLKAFGDTRGANRFRMTLHCKGEIDGYEEFYFAGREVVVDSDGLVSSYPWMVPGGAWAFVYPKFGTGVEAAWGPLLSAVPDLWTPDHRARGIAQTLAQFVNPGLSSEKFLQLYQGGVPDVEVLIRAERNVFDPRTQGYAWTTNGILNALHILLSYPEFSLADFDMDLIAAEADRADTLVATKAGDMPRARCSGVWSSETARGENMAKVLESIGAWIVPTGDGEKLGLRLIDDDPLPEVAISAEDIVEISWQSGPQGVERPNLCRLRYYSPERNYDMGEVDLSGIAWARVQPEIDAYGEKALDLNLLFCPDSGQAQARARQMFALARADSGVIKTNMAGLAVWGCKIVSVELPDDLGIHRCLIGAPRVLDEQGQVEIPFVVWPTLDEWNVDVDEAEAPEPIPDLAYGNPLPEPAAPTAATVVTYLNATIVTRVAYTIPGSANIVEASYRTYAGVNPNQWQGMTEVFSPALGIHHAYALVNLVGQRVDFRVRWFDDIENGSGWSEHLVVDPVAVNNSAPGAPSLQLAWDLLNGFIDPPILSVTVTAPAELQVAYLTLGGMGAPEPEGIWPGQALSWNPDVSGFLGGQTTYAASAHASNGAASGTLAFRVHYNGNPTVRISAEYSYQTSLMTIRWAMLASVGVTDIAFSGGGSPSGIPVSGPTSGSWVHNSPTPGANAYVIEAYDGMVLVATATATVTL